MGTESSGEKGQTPRAVDVSAACGQRRQRQVAGRLEAGGEPEGVEALPVSHAMIDATGATGRLESVTGDLGRKILLVGRFLGERRMLPVLSWSVSFTRGAVRRGKRNATP